ncbi:MAG: efflux RND transporter periplasmic adaptor subunit [Polyangiaceae bacterium]
MRENVSVRPNRSEPRPALSRALRSRLALAGVVASLAFGVGAGCKRPGAEGDAAVAEKKPAQVQPVGTKTFTVIERSVQPRLEISGTLDPDERSEVASLGTGTVLEVNFDIGSRVKKNDVLAVLDSREASLRLEMANANTASQAARLGIKGGKFDVESVSDVRAAREARDLADTEYERAKGLFDSGAISKAQLDQAKTAKERADAGYESTRNGTEQAWVALMASQSQANLSSKSLDDTKVRAPFDGSVEARRVSPGEFASMGRVIAVLVSDEVLRFRFDVPESRAALVGVDGKVELNIAAFPNRVFTGKVKRIGASVKTQTRTLPVEAEVENSEHVLRPGFFARGHVELSGDAERVLLVPKSALTQAASGYRLFVRDGDHVVERLVTVGDERGPVPGAPPPAAGATADVLVEVRGQIAINEEVAVENVAQLADGTPITLP